MNTTPDQETLVIVGVDTHGDTHVAVAIDQLGRLLGSLQIPTTRQGYAALVDWASQFGMLDRFGVEGTASFGAGLRCWLRTQGLIVVEADRVRPQDPPARQVRSDRR
jgi:transposase